MASFVESVFEPARSQREALPLSVNDLKPTTLVAAGSSTFNGAAMTSSGRVVVFGYPMEMEDVCIDFDSMYCCHCDVMIAYGVCVVCDVGR